MRILYGADTFAPDVNGSATFARALAAGMAARGHDVHVMAPAQPGKVGVFIEEHSGQNLTVHRIRSWRWYPHPWLRFMLPWRIQANARRVVDAIQPDVIHFQSHIIVGRGLASVAKERGIRLVGTNHTMPENIVQHVQILPKFIIDWVVRLQWASANHWFTMADVVTAPTQRAADYFEQATGMRGILAISCGLDATLYTADLTPRSRNVVVFLGRLDDEKHIDEAIAALPRLKDLDIELRIVGDGDARHRLEAAVLEHGVGERVHFTGKVSYDQLRAELTAASMFVMPSRAELQSIATLEALASGLPVVGADAMALPHLVHDGENGYLYPPGDVPALAARIRDVLTASPEERERMQRASLAIVESHDVGHTVSTFEELYRGDAAASDARSARGGSSAG